MEGGRQLGSWGFCLHTRLCRVNIFVEPSVRLQTMIFNTAVPLTGAHFMKMVTKKLLTRV
jgi:hypothetical protein